MGDGNFGWLLAKGLKKPKEAPTTKKEWRQRGSSAIRSFILVERLSKQSETAGLGARFPFP